MRSHLLFLFATFIFYSVLVFAQAPNIQWQKSFGGTKGDRAYSVQATSDGGYIMAGSTNSTDGDVLGHHGPDFDDCWIVKINNVGTIQWQKCLGGSFTDRAFSIQATPDGGYILAGNTSSNDGDVTGLISGPDYWIVKLNGAGDIIWQKCLGGSNNEEVACARVTPDGGYLIAGSSLSSDGDVTGNHGNFDTWVVKLNGSGSIQWKKALGGTGTDGASDAQCTADGGYIIAVRSASDDGDVTGHHGEDWTNDFWMVKLDANGNIIWQKSYGGTGDDEVQSVVALPSGSCVAAGTTASMDGDVTGNHSSGDCWILKLDPNGDKIWDQFMGGTNFDLASSIQSTTAGDLIVAGYLSSGDHEFSDNHGGYDYFVARLSSNGDVITEQLFGGSNDDFGTSVFEATDGGCIVTGYSASDNGDVSGHQGPTGDEVANDDNAFDLWAVKMQFIFYKDQDGDGFGDASSFTITANPPPGTTGINHEDCNDQDATINPDALEIADGIDNNCDESADELPACWKVLLGGSDNDEAQSISMTADGGYIVAGSTRSDNGDVSFNHGFTDDWIVKLNTSGSIEWEKSLGGSSFDVASSVEQTSDGGYIVAGSSSSKDGDVTGNHKDNDYWIVKLDFNGAIQWQKSLGGKNDDQASSIKQTSDGGYIVAGNSKSLDGDITGHHGTVFNPDIWLVKLSASGNVVWQKSLGGTSSDVAASVELTPEGGYLICGSSHSKDGDVTGNHNKNDIWIVKVNATGSIVWEKSFGGSEEDFGSAVKQTPDGGYLVAGYTQSKNGDVTFNQGINDYWILKLDGVGDITWQKSFGGNANDVAKALTLSPDGFLVSGYSSSFNGDVTNNHGYYDGWTIKFDENGNVEWKSAYGGIQNDQVQSALSLNNGSYVLAGFSTSNDSDLAGNHGADDYWITKLQFPLTGYKDVDGDGFGNPDESISECGVLPIGYINNNNDCNDADPTIHPGAADVCNGIDDDCNGLIDDNAPKAKIIPLGDLDICTTGYVILKANSGSGYTYQWLLNNAEIPGATKKQYTATTVGNYKVEVTNTSDCSKTSKKVTVFTSCKEMNELLSSTPVTAYPNPFQDVTHLDLLKLNWSEDQIEIRITDLSGKILFQKTFSYQDNIEIGDKLSHGFYLVEVKGKNQHLVIPIVKE